MFSSLTPSSSYCSLMRSLSALSSQDFFWFSMSYCWFSMTLSSSRIFFFSSYSFWVLLDTYFLN